MSFPSSSSTAGVKAWSSASSSASATKRRTRSASLGASADTVVQRYDECRIDASGLPGDALLSTTRGENMLSHRLRRLLAIAVLALAVPAVAQANTVTQWNKTAIDTLVAFPPPAGSAAQALQLDMAMTQGAVYDAVNAIEPRHRPYLLGTPFVRTASKDAAASTAAYRVLSNIVTTVPATIAFPNRAALLTSLGAAYAASLATVPDGASKDAGIAAGSAAADAMIAARANDGRFGPSPWVSNPSPGHWQPLLNPDGSLQLDPAPWVANVKPFLLHSPSQFRSDGPNALGSKAY